MRSLHLVKGRYAVARSKLGDILTNGMNDTGNVVALIDGIGVDLSSLKGRLAVYLLTRKLQKCCHAFQSFGLHPETTTLVTT